MFREDAMVRYSAAALVLLLTPGLFAQEPVKKIEDGVLDRIELYVPSLDHVNELTAVIKPFDAASAELGTGGKNGKDARQDEAKTMQQEGPRVLADRFVSALSHDGPFKDVRIADGDDTGNADLIIEGKFVTLDPGSRAKRYFVGFGAGKSAVKVTGTVKDASGRVLAVFTQRRVGAMGMGGGDSLGKLMTDARKIGEDIANFLSKWARGDDLDG
jgi:hypothetical protein